jgi:hypothetical protein
MSDAAITFTKKGFMALVARVTELENAIKKLKESSNGTISPPPGRVVDRNRSYSNNSTGSSSSELSSLENFNGNAKELTGMPCKPKYGEVVCSALLDGWLIHGSTYDYKDMIKANGARWFGKGKGWALNSKPAVGRILKKINISKKLEKVKNSFQNLGFKFYNKPEEKVETRPLSDEEMEKENENVDTFLKTNNKNEDAKTHAKKHAKSNPTVSGTCLIDESSDDSDFEDDDDDSGDTLDITDGEEEE